MDDTKETPCPYCKKMFDIGHPLKCSARPVSCKACGTGPMMAYQMATVHLTKECPSRLVPCPLCNDSIPYESLEDHKTTRCPMIARDSVESLDSRGSDEIDIREARNVSEAAVDTYEDCLDEDCFPVASPLITSKLFDIKPNFDWQKYPKCTSVPNWDVLTIPGCLESLSRGECFMNFTCKPAGSLNDKERAFAHAVINVDSEMAKEKGQAGPVDFYSPSDCSKYVAILTRASYVLPNLDLTKMTPYYIASADYQKACTPPNLILCPREGTSDEHMRTFRSARPIIPYVFSVVIQMRVSVITDHALLKSLEQIDNEKISHALLLERTKRTATAKDDSTYKVRHVLLFYSLPSGGTLVTSFTCVCNTYIPKILASLVHSIGSRVVAEVAETAHRTRKYLLIAPPTDDLIPQPIDTNTTNPIDVGLPLTTRRWSDTRPMPLPADDTHASFSPHFSPEGSTVVTIMPKDDVESLTISDGANIMSPTSYTFGKNVKLGILLATLLLIAAIVVSVTVPLVIANQNKSGEGDQQRTTASFDITNTTLGSFNGTAFSALVAGMINVKPSAVRIVSVVSAAAGFISVSVAVDSPPSVASRQLADLTTSPTFNSKYKVSSMSINGVVVISPMGSPAASLHRGRGS